MQATFTGYVGRTEWRWVTIVSALTLFAMLLPYLVVTAQAPDQTFMGVLHKYEDGAAYLSKMDQGANGNWLTFFQHTPEPHASALIHPLYMLLGHLTRLSFFPPLLVFHGARVLATLVMFSAIYQLGANIWVKLRARRIFFVLAVFGSGFGWIIVLLSSGDLVSPDVNMPHMYPLYAAMVSIHYPLSIAFQAMIASVFIAVFRPGFTSEPTVDNGGTVIFLGGVVLAFLFQEALLPIIIAVIGSVLARWVLDRKVKAFELRWAMWLIVPIFPIAAYYTTTIQSNLAVGFWLSQRPSALPSLVLTLLGLGLPLVLSIPGLARALRRFEEDGDRFMLLWLFAMVVSYFVASSGRVQYLAGIMIPIAYFATRAIEDYWFKQIFSRRIHQQRIYIALFPIVILTNLFVLFLPVSGVMVGERVESFLPNDYVDTFHYLNTISQPNEVVMAAPVIGTWLPAYTDLRSYYGHPAETLHAAQRRSEVMAFYRAQSQAACSFVQDASLFRSNGFVVQYVLYGPEEARFGQPPCLEDLTLLTRIGDVQVYTTQFVDMASEPIESP
ncbi:MAG: hypothetical protein CL607_13045 [Anaerolineaceae bacterium]|nr:hypothetical protein [Anaerolineaceae bacterium]